MSADFGPSLAEQLRPVIEAAFREREVRTVQRARRDAAERCLAAAETERAALASGAAGASAEAAAMADRLAATFRDLAGVKEVLDYEHNSG